MALSKANIALTVRPTNRNGSESSQIKGNNTTARMAKGQHSTNKMHQLIMIIRSFMIT